MHHVTFYHVTFYHVSLYHVIFYHVTFYHVSFYRTCHFHVIFYLLSQVKVADIVGAGKTVHWVEGWGEGTGYTSSKEQ